MCNIIDFLLVKKFKELRAILNNFKSLSAIFHLLIIAIFMLSVNGCGYKKAPYYKEEAPKGDENVKFIIKEPTK